MASPNEDSLHAHEPNANPTYTYILYIWRSKDFKNLDLWHLFNIG